MIPKVIIDQAQLNDRELNFKIIDEGLLIQPLKKPRQGWKKLFKKAQLVNNSDEIDKEWLDAQLVENNNNNPHDFKRFFLSKSRSLYVSG